MANEIRTLLNSQAKVRPDWKEDWKEDVRPDWRVDWAVDTGQPVNTVVPAITGTATVGQTLTTTNGTWTGTATIVFTRTWLRGSTIIAGATGLTYVLTAADVGKAISVQVRASNAQGTVDAVTAATATVA